MRTKLLVAILVAVVFCLTPEHLASQGISIGGGVTISANQFGCNRVSATDPGCTTGSFPVGYPGKLWIQPNPASNSIIKECEWVSGSLSWVTK